MASEDVHEQEQDDSFEDQSILPVPAGPGTNSEWRGPQIKLNKFGGSRTKYKAWKTEVQVFMRLHAVPEERQVLLLYLALEEGAGKPRDLLSHMGVEDVALSTPEILWKRLDGEYLELSHNEADEALEKYEKCKRTPGQPMRDYLMNLRLARIKMEKEPRHHHFWP